MNEKVRRNVGDGTELTNAAIEILSEFHGQCAHYLASEWCDWRSAESVPADCPEANGLYDAALVVVARWYGIRDVANFRRYLANFSAEKGDAL